MKIQIKEPCSENWTEMSASQQGAFCQKCAVDVIDFSNKTKDEVKTLLLSNASEKMCGRFSKNQLEDLNQAYQIWENQSIRTFQSKFLWACLIAFGVTLFQGCQTTLAQNEHIINPEIIGLTLDDSIKVSRDTIANQPIDTIHTEPFILGDIAYEPDIFDSVKTNCESTTLIKNDSTKAPSLIEQHPELIMGRFVMPPKSKEFLNDSTKTSGSSK